MMRKRRIPLPALAVTAGLSACGAGSPAGSVPDEYELYAMVIEQVQSTWGSDTELVIHPRTYSSGEGRFAMFVPWEGSTGLDIEHPVAAAYNEANKHPPILLDETRLAPGVRYLTEEEQAELEVGSTIWRQNIVILRFARPGFAHSSSMALLQYGVLCGPNCGEGTWIRFTRADGRWIVDAEVAAWSS